MQTTRNVIVVIGALAVWLVAIAIIVVGGYQTLEAFGNAALPFVSELFRHHLLRLVIHSALGYAVGFIIGLGVVSSQPLKWGIGAALFMAALALLTTVDAWFMVIQIQHQVAQLLVSIAPAVASVFGSVTATKWINRRDVKNVL